MPTPDDYFQLQRLLDLYARLIDEDRLEEWVELFSPEGRYEIISRENLAQGFALPLMLCENRNQIADRVMSLRKANIYNIHTDRHIISQLHVERSDDGWRVGANYVLFQTNQEGVSSLYSVGRYDDLVRPVDGRLMFFSKRVIVDTGAVPSLLATPI
ncbi:MAG: aromatic-ring-hydroxylating dioxygenase subunit beta [Janthinobacterium lividum]|uniref:aromatic-ring-hydroxylating dioxygenase subunit beta n=1 Tax=Pseudomonas sp. MWU16-30317 TaxID=2878095 RepID=UPI001CFB144B|nr:aromatic-ring-hydroxylating dioxygenase subunit beta [Pseudomonas sp. MWU16-30317]